MSGVVVIVSWGKYRETIQVDLKGLRTGYSEVRRTTETHGSEHYQWITTSVFESDNQGAGVLTISYKEDANPDLDGRWGRAVYHLNKKMMQGRVEWIDDDPEYVVAPRSWKRFSRDANLLSKKERQSVERIARQQAKLRKQLLMIDPRCAITGETEQALLEAAHILPAAREGSEIPENGLLLRADLHRLYDANLLDLKSDGTLKLSEALRSRGYLDPKFKSIESGALARITRALRAKKKR